MDLKKHKRAQITLISCLVTLLCKDAIKLYWLISALEETRELINFGKILEIIADVSEMCEDKEEIAKILSMYIKDLESGKNYGKN